MSIARGWEGCECATVVKINEDSVALSASDPSIVDVGILV